MSSLRTFVIDSRFVAWAAGLCAACLLAIGAPSASEGRVWTSTTGQKTTGDFVRMHEGLVVLKAGTKIVKIAPKDFCPEDINYLLTKIPPDQIDQLPDAPAVRDWHDTKGNTVSARLIGFKDGKVVLLRENVKKPLEVPFEKLAAVDQALARKALEDRGLGSKLPEISEAEASVAEEAAEKVAAAPPVRPAAILDQPAMPLPRPAAPLAQPEMPLAPQAQPAPSRAQPLTTAPAAKPANRRLARLAALREARQQQQSLDENFRTQQTQRDATAENQRQQRQAMEESRQKQQQQLAAADAQRRQAQQQSFANTGPDPTQAAREAEQRQRQQEQQRMQPARPQPLAQNAAAQAMFCSQCKKQVPDSIQAGDSCPHCGIFFGEKHGANGKVEKATNWTYLVMKFGAMVVAAVIVAAFRQWRSGG